MVKFPKGLLKNSFLKKLLPIIIVVILCGVIIFIGGPKQKTFAKEPLTPLVYQNRETGLYGAMDSKRNLIIDPKYKTLFSKELDGTYYFIGTTKDKETDILTDEGKILDTLPSTYSQVSVLSLSKKLIEVTNATTKSVGVVNFNNQVIINPEYTSLELKGDFIVLNPLSNESIANTTGKIIVSSKDYTSAKIEGNGIVVTDKHYNYGLIDFSGKVILKPTYNKIYGVFGNIFALQNNNGLYALYNISNNNTVTSFKYTSIEKNATSSPFLACKVTNGVSYYGYIDSRGSTIIPFEFQSAYKFNGNYAIVQQNGVYGLIDKSGNFLIKPKYNIIPGSAYAIESFQKGYYYVGYLNGNSSILNSKGDVIATVPGIVQTISHDTVFYQNSSSQNFLYNLDTKKTTDVKLYLQPLSEGTRTPAGYFGAYKSLKVTKYPNSMYLYEEGTGIISVNGYTSIKFENGLFICQSESRYDILEPNGKVLLSFNPTTILNISITPDKIIYIEKLNPRVGNRMKATISEEQNTRLIYLYNFSGKLINLKEKHIDPTK